MHMFVSLFVTMRPAGTRVFANYIGTVLQSFNNELRSALPPGLSQNPRGIPQPRIASPPRSEAQDSSSQPARPIVRSRFDT
jgi:hypothetical protein